MSRIIRAVAVFARTSAVLASAGLVSAGLISCASGAPATRPARVRLIAISPDSVQLIAGNVTEVELRGTGFDTSRTAPQNVVRVGLLELRQVPSRANGTVIRVAIPEAVPSSGEAPPARWIGGRYPVTVSTPAGTSDTLSLTIIMSGGRFP